MVRLLKIYTEPIHAEKNGKLEEVSTNLVESPDKNRNRKYSIKAEV